LDNFGLDHLHTTKFLHSTNIIEKVRTDEDDYKILAPFIRVVQQQLLDPAEGFAVTVLTDCEAYNQLTNEEKRVIRPPLRHSFEIMIGSVCKIVSPVLSRANPIAFEVDETDVPKAASDLLESFIYLKKQSDLYRKSLGGLCFVDDKMLRAAQAADLLGNIVLKGWRKKTVDDYYSPSMRALLSRSDGTQRSIFLWQDQAALRKIAAQRIDNHRKFTNVSELESLGIMGL
jgi:hypothetical protein